MQLTTVQIAHFAVHFGADDHIADAVVNNSQHPALYRTITSWCLSKRFSMKSDSKRPFLTEKKFADGLISKQLAPDNFM
jgi:hypothetical protein